MLQKPRSLRVAHRLSSLLWPLVFGCSGDIAEGGAPGSGQDSAGNVGASGSANGGGSSSPIGVNPGGVELACDDTAPLSVAPLMKLSTVQYQNTVRDLLRAVGAEAALPNLEGALATVPEDSLGEGFRGLDNRISLEHVQSYFNVGTALGEAIQADAGLLAAVAGSCAAGAVLGATCVDEFLDRFVRLVYRRPLAASEREQYRSLNDGVRTPSAAIRAMVVMALSSPPFVYQVEVDGTLASAQPDVLALSPYEVASRLSYTFWQTMPDAPLFAAADDGSLMTPSGFGAQLERVFGDPRTHETLFQFWNEWFKLEKFTGFETTRPAFQALAAGESIGEPGHDHYADMVNEVRDLTELFTYGRTATVADILTTDLSVTRSADLARLYGVEPWSGSGNYPRLPSGTRAGLLQRAALLVSNLEQTNPFHRGALVRRSLLCDALPEPDPNALPPGSLDPPPPSTNATTRERFQAKVDGNGLCLVCHGAFSDIGYVMESFDALGRYRTTEVVYDEATGQQLAELPIDTRAVPRISAGDDLEVANAAELNQRVVDSGKVEACLAQNYFAFMSRRNVSSGTLDACVIEDLKATLADPGQGIARAFKRLAEYAVFFQRKVGPQ